MKFTFGTDPELFLTLGNKFISAHGLFPGTKHEPYKVEKGAVQVDGLALEFNIDPASTAEEFSNNIETVLTQMKEMVSNVDKDMKINFVPYAEFEPKYFESVDGSAKVLGCDPDFNIHGFVNNAPDISDKPFRTAAGHIHIGWTNGEDVGSPNHFADCMHVANFFEKRKKNSFYEARTPLEKKRVGIYGGNGSFRPKTYGVELRSPSNIWVEYSQSRIDMFNYTAKMMNNISAN
jgi:hypothetical protein